MFELRRRNLKFKKDLPFYRFALRQWMWRGKKKMNRQIFERWEIMKRVEVLIFEWECHEGFITRFFIAPPDEWIQEILKW